MSVVWTVSLSREFQTSCSLRRQTYLSKFSNLCAYEISSPYQPEEG